MQGEALLLVLGREVGHPRGAAVGGAPPSSSNETSSWVTARITSGPVTNM